MFDQAKNMMIGIFVIAAFSIVIFIMLFLHPKIGDEGKIIRVRFVDIDKVTEGTRVTYAGRPVGEVYDIKEIEEGRVVYNGLIYVYELVLRIDSHVVVNTTDEITSRTSGLLGEKSVSIMPSLPKPGEEVIPVTNQILYAAELGSLETTLREFKELADKVELTLDGFIDALGKLRDREFWENISITAKNLGEITDAINKPNELSDIVTNINATAKNMTDITEAINKPEKLTLIVDNFADTSTSLKDVVINIEKGEGSLGKIIVKDDLYLQLSSILSKGETTLDDINHYGILFHLDKGWQRLRARRLNLLQSLQTPQEYRNYFNDEIDSISTALARVSMVLEKTDEQCDELWRNPEYIKVYGELLRRVATLEEYLQMYNQQVVDTQVKRTELINCPCNY